MGAAGKKYGIWNSVTKCWQFGIVEDTPMLAEARLFQRIGDDANKRRFQAKEIPPSKIVKTKRPCKICGQKPYFSCGEYDQSGSQIQIAEGNWTTMYAGVDENGCVFLCALGDGYTDRWYPRFCPECGRRINEGRTADGSATRSGKNH